MATILRWTGREARALRHALHMSVRGFASYLGAGTRTVATWDARGTAVVPRPELQAALATALLHASDDAKARFDLLLEDAGSDTEVSADASNRRSHPPHGGRDESTSVSTVVSQQRQGTGGGIATDRRQFIGTALILSGHAATEVGSSAADQHDEQMLRAVVEAYRRVERRHSSPLLIDAVASCVELIRSAIRNARSPGTGLYATLSESAGLAAWLWADVGDDAAARRSYQLAVQAAGNAHDASLEAYMQASLGDYAVRSGDTGYGLSLIQGARGRLPKAPRFAHAWLDALEATALAECHDRGAFTLLSRAEKRIPPNGEEPAWPWIFRFDHTKLAMYRAICSTRFSMVADAEAAFAEAASALQAPKQRALLQVEYAKMLLISNDLEASCQAATNALSVANEFGSERVRQGVRKLRAAMGDRPGRTIASLDERLAEAYREGT